MSGKVKKSFLLVLAALLLAGTSQLQRSLNRDRDLLGLTRTTPLENAPPMLAFTTVALGGFRGLISNYLWIRANDLQNDDKFFEAAQLSDWITKLEPNFSTVWVHLAWNMAYNISVKFKDPNDRWRWVQAGIVLLRDEGLRYNPNDVLMYRELAWFYQHKMGANIDDAHRTYKKAWAAEMAAVLGDQRTPDFDALISPVTDDARSRAKMLREKYKLDPALMKEIDGHYGPIDWRLPEAHAIYWAMFGMRVAKEHPDKVKKDDIISLRRVVFQSMKLAFDRGRRFENPLTHEISYDLNLDIVDKVVLAYEEMIAGEPDKREYIRIGERNFLREAVWQLCLQNRIPEAQKWFDMLGKEFPGKAIVDEIPGSLPGTMTLDEYMVARVQGVTGETSEPQTRDVLQGLLLNHYLSIAVGDDGRAAAMEALAQKIHANYQSKITKRETAIGLPPLEELAKQLLERMLDPEQGVPVEVQLRLRSKLNLPAAATPATNAPAR